VILVDELQHYPGRRLPFPSWCHMVSDDSFAELHRFAAELGIPRGRFDGDHYDLPPPLREHALAAGAEAVGARELVARMSGPRGDRVRARRAARRT
jgi:hypothetical protein